MAAWLPREKFLEFLRQHSDFSMEIARPLSEDLQSLYRKFETLARTLDVQGTGRWMNS